MPEAIPQQEQEVQQEVPMPEPPQQPEEQPEEQPIEVPRIINPEILALFEERPELPVPMIAAYGYRAPQPQEQQQQQLGEISEDPFEAMHDVDYDPLNPLYSMFPEDDPYGFNQGFGFRFEGDIF
jgi:hypothetical protein